MTAYTAKRRWLSPDLVRTIEGNAVRWLDTDVARAISEDHPTNRTPPDITGEINDANA